MAKLAGVPGQVLERSREILAHLEENAIGPNDQPSFAPKKPAPALKDPTNVQMPLFKPLDARVREELLALDTASMTPLEALSALDDIVRRLKGNES